MAGNFLVGSDDIFSWGRVVAAGFLLVDLDCDTAGRDAGVAAGLLGGTPGFADDAGAGVLPDDARGVSLARTSFAGADGAPDAIGADGVTTARTGTPSSLGTFNF